MGAIIRRDGEVLDGEVVTPPEPILAGTFGLFERPNGSMVLAYRLADGTEGRRVIPALMVRRAMKYAQRQAESAGDGLE